MHHKDKSPGGAQLLAWFLPPSVHLRAGFTLSHVFITATESMSMCARPPSLTGVKHVFAGNNPASGLPGMTPYVIIVL